MMIEVGGKAEKWWPEQKPAPGRRLLQKLVADSPSRVNAAPTPESCQQVSTLIELCRVLLKVVQLMSTMKTWIPDIVVSAPACIQTCFTNGMLQAKALQESFSVLVVDEVSPEEVESVLGENDTEDSKFIAPFPLLSKNDVESLRYRAEDVARSVTKIAVRESHAKDLRTETLNSEKLQAHFQDNPGDLDLLKHDEVLSKKEPAAHLCDMPEYLKDSTTEEVCKILKITRAAMGNAGSNRRKGFKGKFKKSRDPLKTFSAEMGFRGQLLAAAAAVALLVFSATADPNDEQCLTHLSQSLEDPFKNLQNWTKATFANPCLGFTSFLQGATCNNGRIYKLSLSNLALKGTISPFLSNCTNLQALDLSSNQLSGPIPPDLQYLVNLAVLNLSANHLSGPIPQQLTLCAYLNVIDLHDNQLSGPIPQQLGLLVRLSVFDVSNNKLSGPIPSSLGNRSGNLPRFNASSFGGNKGLYGYPLPPMKSRGLSVLAIVGIGLGSGLASLILSFTAVCIWLRVTEQKLANDEGKISQLMPDY